MQKRLHKPSLRSQSIENKTSLMNLLLPFPDCLWPSQIAWYHQCMTVIYCSFTDILPYWSLLWFQQQTYWKRDHRHAPIYNSFKDDKVSWNNLIKEVKGLHSENFKSPKKEIKTLENAHRGINIVKLAILPKSIYRVSPVPIKLSRIFSIYVDKS